jgi:hypothetical protein
MLIGSPDSLCVRFPYVGDSVDGWICSGLMEGDSGIEIFILSFARTVSDSLSSYTDAVPRTTSAAGFSLMFCFRIVSSMFRERGRSGLFLFPLVEA